VSFAFLFSVSHFLSSYPLTLHSWLYFVILELQLLPLKDGSGKMRTFGWGTLELVSLILNWPSFSTRHLLDICAQRVVFTALVVRLGSICPMWRKDEVRQTHTFPLRPAAELEGFQLRLSLEATPASGQATRIMRTWESDRESQISWKSVLSGVDHRLPICLGIKWAWADNSILGIYEVMASSGTLAKLQ
jgi:hypothetical protein